MDNPCRRIRLCRLLATTLAGMALALPALAHDSWFEALDTAGDGGVQLLLGTGNRFPVHELGVAAPYLASAGCRSGGRTQPLSALRDEPTALRLQAGADNGRAGSCWAQLQPFEIVLPADKVAPYLKEVNPSAALRRIWAERQARGLPWKERYTKHARIELPGSDARPLPSGMGLDLLLDSDGAAPRVGGMLRFQALRDGQPLANFAVELQNAQLAVGIWRRTDASGHVEFPAALPGRWLLRGIDLRGAADDPDAWDSRFVTLAFDMLPRLQNGSSLNSNSRSASQMPATAAISSEPANSTTRR